MCRPNMHVVRCFRKWRAVYLIFMKEDMLSVHIKGVAIPSEDSAPVVILEDPDGTGTMTVSVGAAEASAILMELEGISTPRPLTHALMAQVFREQGLCVRAVELYGLYGAAEEGFLARLEYRKGFRTWTRDVRPSDALALALATGAPVYAHRSLMHPATTGQMRDFHETDGWYMEAARA